MAKYVALSDLHLGQNGQDGSGEVSVVSASARAPSRYVELLTKHIDNFTDGKPYTLVLVGDILDLSLAYFDDALRDFVDLTKRLGPLLQDIVWVIGNHDHHVWMLESEHRNLVQPIAQGRLPPHGGLYQATSGLWPLTTLQGALKPKISIAYPSYTLSLKDSRSPTGHASVYFTHGHLFGGMYTATTDLLKSRLGDRPHERVAATVNAPLNELVYWLLGEVGEGFGADGLMEQILASLKERQNDDLRQRQLLDDGLRRWFPNGFLPSSINWLVRDDDERAYMKDAIVRALQQAVGGESSITTSSARRENIRNTRRGLENWVNDARIDRTNPGYVVYGHTHRPDSYDLSFDPRWKGINLGGWVSDPQQVNPEAAVLTVEESSGAPLAVTLTRI